LPLAGPRVPCGGGALLPGELRDLQGKPQAGAAIALEHRRPEIRNVPHRIVNSAARTSIGHTMEDIIGTKGRPRDQKATGRIQAVALDLAYSGGIGNATVERIAEHAGVSKTTIYRRWPNAVA